MAGRTSSTLAHISRAPYLGTANVAGYHSARISTVDPTTA